MSTRILRAAGGAPRPLANARAGPAERPARVPAPSGRLHRRVRTWLESRLERQFLQSLAELDERMLRDIGVRRVELPEPVRTLCPEAGHVLDRGL